MNKKSAIAILGGMGPQASVYLYKLIIEMSESLFDAKNNDDYPEVILYSVPVPDFIADDKSRDKSLEMLNERVQFINKSNASYLAIACNTAHILLPNLQVVSKIPFVSMIYEVTRKVNQDGMKKIGLLGTSSTIKYGLYQDALKEYGISLVIPSQQQIAILEKIIRNVLSGKLFKDDGIQLKKISDDLKKKGAEAIILGCTELPLVFPKKYSLPVYNSVKILAIALLRKYYLRNGRLVTKGGGNYGENAGKASS